VFSDKVYVPELHDKYLPETYFPIVAAMNRYPRYKNKRVLDPQVKIYLDENNIEEPFEWGLPVPNAEAAYISLSKYGKDIKFMTDIQVKAMNKAWTWTERQFYTYMNNSSVRTVDEAIEHLDKKTSSGAPFNNKYPTKEELFEEMPEFRDWLEQDWIRLAEDPEWTCICTNSLKEEMRPREKIEVNSIRTFTAMPTDMTVHGNRLFGEMNDKMNASHLVTASAVGMSPYYGNWNRLYQKLKVFQKGYALDESQYDSSLRAYMMWACAKLRWNMLAEKDRTPENLRRIKTVYRNLVNSLILTPDGLLVLKLTGNPSGSPNTINDNTLVLYALMAYAWIMSNPETSYEEFEENTSKALVGDDNTWTVSDWAHEFYNAKTVIKEWALIGVTTTTDSLEPRPAEELDFLSAKTIFMQGQALPLYDRTKLMSTLLYAPKEHLSPTTTLLRVGALLSVGWTDIPFRNFCRRMIDWLIEKYDQTMSEEDGWRIAKCGVLSDERYFKLFMGKQETLYRQGFSGEKPHFKNGSQISRNVRKMNKLDNLKIIDVMNLPPLPKTPKKNGSRRGRNRARKGQVTRKSFNRGSKLAEGRKRKEGYVGSKARNGGGKRHLTGKGGTQNSTTNRNSTVIEEDEYIAAVTVAAQPAFNVVSYPVNIGLSATFPWGNSVAKNYQKYRFEYLEFYYKRAVSEFATAGTTGKVMLFFNPDASDGPPSNKQQIEDSMCHKDGMPCENIRLVVPKGMLQKLNDAYFIRAAGIPGNTDIKTYDIGSFHIATQGITANDEIGELHVRYKVKVLIPVIGGLQLAPVNTHMTVYADSSAQTYVTTVAARALLAGTATNGLDVVNTSGLLTLPVGTFLVIWSVKIKDTAAETFTVSSVLRRGGTTGLEDVEFSGSVMANYITTLTNSCYVSSDGTQTIEIWNTMTGATGTLTGSSNITILSV